MTRFQGLQACVISVSITSCLCGNALYFFFLCFFSLLFLSFLWASWGGILCGIHWVRLGGGNLNSRRTWSWLQKQGVWISFQPRRKEKVKWTEFGYLPNHAKDTVEWTWPRRIGVTCGGRIEELREAAAVQHHILNAFVRHLLCCCSNLSHLFSLLCKNPSMACCFACMSTCLRAGIL